MNTNTHTFTHTHLTFVQNVSLLRQKLWPPKGGEVFVASTHFERHLSFTSSKFNCDGFTERILIGSVSSVQSLVTKKTVISFNYHYNCFLGGDGNKSLAFPNLDKSNRLRGQILIDVK